jgi:hypothetical protein
VEEEEEKHPPPTAKNSPSDSLNENKAYAPGMHQRRQQCEHHRQARDEKIQMAIRREEKRDTNNSPPSSSPSPSPLSLALSLSFPLSQISLCTGLLVSG